MKGFKSKLELVCLNLLFCILYCHLTVPETLANPVQWSGNGHWYDLIQAQSIIWNKARKEATQIVWAGSKGSLVTITSPEENEWLTATFGSDKLHLKWIGAHQIPGSHEPDGGWFWVNGDPVKYANWWFTEPNNLIGNENAIVFDHNLTSAGKAWNDLRDKSPEVTGYIIEFGPTVEVVRLLWPAANLFSGKGSFGHSARSFFSFDP
jgi:hypothetical protein